MATALEIADRLAHVAAQGPVRTKPAQKPTRTVLESFPAGAPRGQWPAESFAADLATDSFLVIVEAGS